jgi:hypothetical protein
VRVSRGIPLGSATCRLDHRLALDGQSRGKEDHVANLPGRVIRRDRDVIAAARMANEHVALAQRVENWLDASVKIHRPLGGALAMAGQIERDRLVAQPCELRHDPVPAPGAMEAAMNEDEAHVSLHSFARRIAM